MLKLLSCILALAVTALGADMNSLLQVTDVLTLNNGRSFNLVQFPYTTSVSATFILTF
jgi:hypothetical protein